MHININNIELPEGFNKFSHYTVHLILQQEDKVAYRTHNFSPVNENLLNSDINNSTVIGGLGFGDSAEPRKKRKYTRRKKRRSKNV